jgi:TonB-linked SusC/RagA family outer membrane protein
MKKNRRHISFGKVTLPLKCLLWAKFNVIVFCIFSVQSFAGINAQDNISLNLKDVPITNVFRAIEDQGQYRFVYKNETIPDNVVTVRVKNASLDDVLKIVLQNTPLVYKKISENLVAITNTTANLNDIDLADIGISGTVKNQSGQPIQGVSVVVKGTSNGTTTNSNGFYSIQVPGSQSVLQFSFVGFVTKEVIVGSQNVIDVTLEDSSQQLVAVVVTALGIKRQAKSLGYSATSVNTSEINTPGAVNFGNNLVGKVAGVNVNILSSGAGGTSKIRIRGQSSFGPNNSPLIVINGVPVNNTPVTSNNPNAQESDLGDALQSVNPDDIESMTVLKGASAAALYGFRAKDGVIIITTKSGSKAKGLGIEVRSSYTAEQALDFTDLQYEYGQGEFGIRPSSVADARTTGGWSFGTKFDGQPVWSIDGEQHPYVPFKDRIKAFYEIGNNLMNSIALSNGNDKGSYRVSISNTNANNIIPNSTYKKTIFETSLNYSFTKKLTTTLNANYSIDENKNPPFGGQRFSIPNSIMTMANSIDPRWLKDKYKDPITGDETRWTRFLDRTNWYWTAYERLELNKKDRLYGSIVARYQLAPWLYVQGRIGQDKFTIYHEVNNPTGTANNPPVAIGYNGEFSQNTSSFREINADFLIGGNKSFGDFGIDATFGGNRMDQISDNLSVNVRNFYIRGLYTIGNGQIKEPNYTYARKKVNSLYGSLNFSFRDYLFLNTTVRNDWFSTLNPKSNSYLYPSVSGSFIVSEAFERSMPKWANYIKLRASYAEVGGDTDPYSNNLYYAMAPNTYNNFAYGEISGNTSPNANLRPLKVKETEAGMELGLFNNRVRYDVAIYRKNTVDEILDVDISNAGGFTTTTVNVGRLRNEGIENLLTVQPIRNKDLTWEFGINYTYNNSMVLELASGQPRIDLGGSTFIGQLSHEVGKPLASLRGYDYLRNEKGEIITINGRFQRGELITFGSGIPKHIGGILNTLTYRKIRLFAQVDFKAGHKLISDTEWNLLRSGHHKKSLPGREGGVIFDGVNPDGSKNQTPVEAESFYTDYSGRRIVTEAVYNASFVRWRTLTVSYDASSLVSKTFIKGLTVSANINNVLMIKRYTDNIDPEAISQVRDTRAGLESTSLPSTRTYSLSLNLKL